MKTSNKLKFLGIFFFLNSLIISAQISKIFNGIEFNESLVAVEKKIRLISSNIGIYKISTPSFPLSNNKEEHLIASKVVLKNGIVDQVAFTFSDNKLSLIQAKGNVIKSIVANIKSEARAYLDYQVYMDELLFIHEKNDTAWLLTKTGVHPNLFAWNNPYLDLKNTSEVAYNPSVKIPGFIKMGENIAVLKPLLQKNSNFVNEENLGKEGGISKAQINCFGIEFAGFSRKFEARFENNKLTKVWILTAKAEENRIRKKLIDQYGKALFTNDKWEVFNNWTVLLRKDKPEILVLNKSLAAKYKKQYTK